jgi:hypothetical protein
MADTVSLNDYINRIGIENTPPDLSGLTFAPQPPEGGKEAGRVYTRFSAAIFNRWDYDAASGRYLRFSDSQDDPEWENEIYEPLMDQLNGQQIGAENIVILLADYIELAKTEESEVYDIDLLGGGMAYGIRDGQLFNLTWSRQAEDERITFFTEDGQPYPLKPGQTWFEIMGYTSTVDLAPDGWRFTFFIP